MTESGNKVPVLDKEQQMPGRGYYICNDPECDKRFVKFKGWRK